MTAEELYLGLDIGGTRTRAVVVGADPRRPVATGSIRTRPGAQGVRASIAEAYAQVAARLGPEMARCRSTGIGIAGLVDQRNSTIQFAGNLDLAATPLERLVGGVLPAPWWLENDVNAAAVGAALLLGDSSNLTFVNVGTGMSTATLVDGQLLRGWRGRAGELGHVPVDPAGAPCTCGQRGCPETVAGGSRLQKRLDLLGATHRVLADSLDPRIDRLRGEVASAVATVVLMAVLAYDPEFVVLGGGIGCKKWLRTRTVDALDEMAAASSLIDALAIGPRITRLPCDAPVAALGAAALGRHRGRNLPAQDPAE